MARRLLTGGVLLGLLVALSGRGERLMTVPRTTGAPTQASTIVLSELSYEPTKKIRRFQPLADYLAANLGAFGIGEGRVTIVTDLQAVVRMMQSGEVHLYFDSPYPAMIVADNSGGKMILRRWKSGVPEYHAVFFARADGGPRSLASLRGKMIAFENAHSTSGYFLPLAYLLRAGMNPVEKPRAETVVPRNQVGFVFASSEENTVLWVLSGKVTAGVTDNVTFAKIPPEARSSLTVLAETPAVARHLVIARPAMPPAILQAIKTLLLRMHETPEGQAVLKAFEDTARFDEIPSGATMTRMREMFRLVQGR